jgi:cytoskeletal protein CcmA (bactofilin family)
MWRKEDANTQAVQEISTNSSVISTSTPAASAAAPRETSAIPPISPHASACISQGIKIRGELSGSEDLFLDGEIEGKLDFGAASLTIGPNGKVKADVTAREVIVRGRVDGKVTGRERVHVWSTGRIQGEIQTDRLAIEDGAVLSGKVEAGKRSEKPKDAFQAAPKPPVEKSGRKDAMALPVVPAAD